MSESKRHHFIPKFILKNFADESNLLWVKREGEPFQTGIVNAFVESELNTFTDKKGNKDKALEVNYSQIESDAKPLVERIIEFSEKKICLPISENDKYTWNVFFYHQYGRAPDIFRKLGIEADFEDVWQQATQKFEEYAKANNIQIDAEELKNVKDPANFDKFKQNTRVTARKNHDPEILATLNRRGLAYGVVTKESDELIIGDHPFVRLGQTGNLEDPTTEFWLPISSKVAVSPYGQALDRKLIELTSSQVHLINSTIFEQSNIIASKQRSIIDGLLPQTSS
ncbi:hypothetical protein PsW64_05301 [Pseudovibrio sp. W64]|uniref:DUF4238 domain-containing protein n=1 Tax=unclassified Pseudovibrio TaxID=2627060 RepID=UPI0007AE6A9D|nr:MULTISPECIES: DUF4238 domain-containing protein [unclassified Pseudovibrio]KZK75397.1 hypothetical protein PsW64_05301 [Pseudovibrio sp. W64]KZK85929.1 hypothetical protein PsAD13_01059 [Pseudovibrio sp. Ad13]